MLSVKEILDSTVRVLCSTPEISDCQEAWNAFQRHPNAEWRFFDLINQLREQIESPCVLVLKSGGETRSIWAGRLERVRLQLSVGYFKLGGVQMRSLGITTGGVMGDDSEEACRTLLGYALRLLKEKRLDLLVLGYLRCDHALFKMATANLPSGYLRDWGVNPSIHWRMQLPTSFDVFLERRSRKHRYWLKRLRSVLENTFPGQVSIRRFNDQASVREFCLGAESVSKMTYQYRLGEAFQANAEWTARCELQAKTGAFRGYILYIQNQPRAYWLATAYQDTLYLNSTGYDPYFRRFEVGTVLLMKLFEDHCGTSIRIVDFGHGDAAYKARFGDESFYEASVRIYRFTPKALFANFLSGFNEKTSTLLKRALLKFGLLQRVKSFWRARMTE